MDNISVVDENQEGVKCKLSFVLKDQLQDNWIFRSPLQRNTFENSFHTSQSVIFSKKYLSFKISGLLISSSTKAEEGTS